MSESTAPEVGARAPEFRLRGPGGQPVTLSEYRGDRHVALAFFPFAFSPVCSHQLPELDERLAPRLDELEAVLFGISVDTHWANSAFRRELDLAFPLLSDFDRRASTDYGVLVPGGSFSSRATFLVDRDGRIAYRDVNPDLTDIDRVPPVEELIAALEALVRR